MPPPPPDPPLVYTISPDIPYDLRSTPVSDLAAQDDHTLCIGVAVLHHSTNATHTGAGTDGTDHSTDTTRILLIQRSAHESLPNKWELPGGSAELDDPNILASAVRELYEETGLRAERVLAQVGEYTWVDVDKDGSMRRRKNGMEARWRKRTFLIQVRVQPGGQEGMEPSVILDPEEHQSHVWATEEELERGLVGDVQLVWTSEEQKADVIRALRHNGGRKVE